VSSRKATRPPADFITAVATLERMLINFLSINPIDAPSSTVFWRRH